MYIIVHRASTEIPKTKKKKLKWNSKNKKKKTKSNNAKQVRRNRQMESRKQIIKWHAQLSLTNK